MKIGSLYCPCNSKNNTLDHYSAGLCEELPAPLGWILSILHEIDSDKTHRDMNITTTRLTSSCARQVAIEDNIPMEGFDFRRHNSLHWGNIAHADLQNSVPAGTYAEVEIPPKGAEAPLVLGLPLRGKLDFVTSDMSEIHDYKTHGERAQEKKLKYPEDNSVRAQLSVYGLMLSRAFGVPLPKLRVWHGAMVSAGGTPWFARDIEPMTEDEILNMKPFNGEYSVRDRINEYQIYQENRKNGMSVEDAIRGMSLMGRSIWRGAKCLKYCTAKDICDKLEGIVGI